MSALDKILSWFNLRRITRTDRARRRICATCLHPIKRSGEPWYFAPQFGDNPKHLLPTHRQCPSLPTLPFTAAE